MRIYPEIQAGLYQRFQRATAFIPLRGFRIHVTFGFADSYKGNLSPKNHWCFYLQQYKSRSNMSTIFHPFRGFYLYDRDTAHGGVQSPHSAPFSLYCYKSVFATKWIYASNGLHQQITDSFYATQRFSINHVISEVCSDTLGVFSHFVPTINNDLGEQTVQIFGRSL